MAQTILSAQQFVSKFLQEKLPLFDARSESEFNHASVPRAFNIPLLTDDHRKEVGTIYKQIGREAAVLKGFELAGPRFHEMIKNALVLAPQKSVMLYCWRGGMRSNILSWILGQNGFHVYLLKGGYKAFRNWAINSFKEPRKVLVLGGATGSGKTELLEQLSLNGEQVIDLENLAHHKGSAFGALGKPKQPSNEMFENKIALEWTKFNKDLPVWLENESRNIGCCMLPEPVYILIRDSELVEINVGDKNRKERITRDYGCFPADTLAEITNKIQKRLGPQHAKQAIELLQSGDFAGWLEIILAYYDKLYNYGTTQRDPQKVHHLELSAFAENQFADQIISLGNSIINKTSIEAS